jgi:branched-chain amino acid transport system substrate-binding protein
MRRQGTNWRGQGRRGVLAGGIFRLALVAVLVVLAAALVAGCGEETTSTSSGGGSQPSGDPIVIGAIVSATGANAALGTQERNVLEMMEGYVNGEGGVLGRPLDIIVEDDKSDPQEAVTAANRLIEQEKVVALIAATGSSSTVAVKAITAEKHIPQMAMVAANVITDEGPIEWIWRTPQKNAVAAARLLEYVSDTLGVSKIGVLHNENAFGSDGMDAITDMAADYGLEIVAAESFKTDDSDLTAQLTSIRSAEPQALVVWDTSQGAALVAVNMQQLGMDIPYVGSHGIANTTFIDLAGDAAEGVVFVAGRLVIPSSITDPDQKGVTDSFIETYEYEWGESPNPFAGYAFEAITILVDAIERAGGTEPEAIQAALNATKDFAGPDGFYNYSETDHDGLVAADMVMVKIENGEWVLVE